MSASLCPACLTPSTGFAVCPNCGWHAGEPTLNPLHLPPGTVVNPPYQVARVLGHGGFGITYLGWDANLQIKVAIKEYLPRDFAHRNPGNGHVLALPGEATQHFSMGLQQFLDEARTLAKFQQHPGIVSVLTFFRAFGTGYMVMEYVEGETLKNYLKRRGGRLNWQQTLDIFMQIMDALRAVHGAGLLHRDIAPDNIYLCSDGRIKLLDFGAARHALVGDDHALVVVKPGFAPEEQYRGIFEQGSWSDVYSVAASMYFCLTGQAPPEALDRAARDTLKPPADYGVALPIAAEQTLLGALAVKAWQRPQSIEELQQRLSAPASTPSRQIQSEAQAGQPPTWPGEPDATDATTPKRRWRWMLSAIAAVLIILVYLLARTGIDKKPAAIVKQHEVPAASPEDLLPPQPPSADEHFDWAAQRDRERAAAEELKQQQAAALRRFEEYRRKESAEPEQPNAANELRQQHLRSLCDEWRATMDCQNK